MENVRKPGYRISSSDTLINTEEGKVKDQDLANMQYLYLTNLNLIKIKTHVLSNTY